MEKTYRGGANHLRKVPQLARDREFQTKYIEMCDQAWKKGWFNLKEEGDAECRGGTPGLSRSLGGYSRVLINRTGLKKENKARWGRGGGKIRLNRLWGLEMGVWKNQVQKNGKRTNWKKNEVSGAQKGTATGKDRKRREAKKRKGAPLGEARTTAQEKKGGET